MFVTMMITGPSSNQGHRSFYPTLYRNEVRKRLMLELSHALLEVLHTVSYLILIMKVSLSHIVKSLIVITPLKSFIRG